VILRHLCQPLIDSPDGVSVELPAQKVPYFQAFLVIEKRPKPGRGNPPIRYGFRFIGVRNIVEMWGTRWRTLCQAGKISGGVAPPEPFEISLGNSPEDQKRADLGPEILQKR
jgi:hypothetical protein